jgi:hypothetical protein
MERDDFKKRYPTLAKEMEEGIGKADLIFEVEAPKPERRFAGYNPGVTDFLRRCSRDEEAFEIIEYLVKRGEVTAEEAEKLYQQIKDEGLRSFGPKKKPGFYEREG